MDFCFLGMNDKVVEHNDFFNKKVVIKGESSDNTISFKDVCNKEIDYNDLRNFKLISEFFDEMIEKLQNQNKNFKFMFYNQAAIEFMNNLENVVCCNDINLVKDLNNKPKCRELLKNEVSLLEYKYVVGEKISFNYINQMFDKKFDRYVVQAPVGFGGVGTFVIDKNFTHYGDINPKIIYSVSGFVENSSSINNTFIISDNYIHFFEGSYQLIRMGKELNYDGYDFESYEKLESTKKEEYFKQTYRVAKKLQTLGYRGIAGVDYLEKDNEIYFMEINPRFQVSSKELDRKYVEKGYPSIFELNYLSFYDEDKFINECKNVK